VTCTSSRRYGVDLKSVGWESHEAPSEEMWTDLAEPLSCRSAKTMVREGDPLRESVQGPVGRGLDSIPFGPCGNIPEPGDFTSAMRQNIQSLRGAL